jgi:hypothetical protein
MPVPQKHITKVAAHIRFAQRELERTTCTASSWHGSPPSARLKVHPKMFAGNVEQIKCNPSRSTFLRMQPNTVAPFGLSISHSDEPSLTMFPVKAASDRAQVGLCTFLCLFNDLTMKQLFRGETGICAHSNVASEIELPETALLHHSFAHPIRSQTFYCRSSPLNFRSEKRSSNSRLQTTQ